MPLSSASTTAQVYAAYADNASYEEHDSLTEARAFVSACRVMLSPAHLVNRSAAGGRSGTEVEYDPATIKSQLESAQAWVSQKLAADGGGVIHADFTNFRT